MANRFLNRAALPLEEIAVLTGSSIPLEYQVSTARPFQWVKAVLYVTAKAGTTPTLDVKIQTSADTLSWTDLTNGAFTQVTGSTGLAYLESIQIPIFTGKYIRFYWTITGTGSPSWTFSADFTLDD